MNNVESRFRVRTATPSDATPLREILNAIIAIGGTTALETPLSPAEFNEYFLTGLQCLSCFVAEDAATGQALGFQGLSRNPDLPADWGDIGTFARPDPKVPGVGTALFTQTRIQAETLGLAAINATIRADNRGGLAYYEKMGFRMYRIAEAVPLRDGTLMDRIYKRYALK